MNDELFELLGKEGDDYDALPDWRKRISAGQYYLTALGFSAGGNSPGSTLAIYGVVTEALEPDDLWGPGAHHEANRLWVRAFSAMCPTGETGRILRSDVGGPISPEAFERARLTGWPSDILYVMAILDGEPGWERSLAVDQDGQDYLACVHNGELVYVAADVQS